MAILMIRKTGRIAAPIGISSAQHDLCQQPGWYRALTLRERVEELLTWENSDPQAEQQARAKIAQWRAQNPFQSGSYFAERLAQDGITEDDLLHLLTETPASLRDRAAVPAWLANIAQAFAEATGDQQSGISAACAADDPTAALLVVVQPLLRQGQQRLRAGLQDIAAQYPGAPSFEREGVLRSLGAHLNTRASFAITRTFLSELKNASVAGKLAGNTPQERLRDHLRQLATPEYALKVLENYCVLARQVATITDQWVAASLEMLERLAHDWPTIRATFALAEPGELSAVQAGLGDSHRGGRSVMCLTLRSGQKIVYKPRSLAIEQHFQEFLAWLNEQGVEPALRTFPLIDRGEYGWVPYLTAEDCGDEAQVQRFYERQGIYLALFYLLGATDMHAGNILASGEHPFFFDLETLFHPWFPGASGADCAQPAEAALLHSVLRVCMLPRRLWGSERAEGVDMSGLGGHAGQLSPHALPRWSNVGTDRMQQVWERQTISLQRNRPRLNGREVQASDYLAQILSGFTLTYRLLVEKRRAVREEVLSRFATDEIRFVPRPTDIYARFLQDGYRPALLRDAWERERHFDRLWVGIARQPHIKSLIPAERADLLNGDIPHFTTMPTSHDLFNSQGECIPGYLPFSAMQQVQQRLEQMGERDLAFQRSIIHNTFVCVLPAPDLQIPASALMPASVGEPRLLAGARWIGDWLAERALFEENVAGWLSITQVSVQSRELMPAHMDLYDGLSGIALFLAYLAECTGETCYRQLAGAALNGVRACVRQEQVRPGGHGIGAFGGWAAPIYLLTHLASLWRDPTLLAEAEAIVDLLPDLVERDRQFDILNGSAGCILAFLGLYEQTGSPGVLEAARHCGRHLLAYAQPMPGGRGWKLANQPQPLTGFAHGSAGIALSLLRLAAISHEEQFRACALEALAYERSLFSPAKSNWPDLRAQFAHAGEPSFMVAWCHGAAGIALSRLAALPYTQDDLAREEIRCALDTTIAASARAGTDPTLCHGLAGLLETLLTARQSACYEDRDGHIERLANWLLALLETQFTPGATPTSSWWTEAPSFMTGLSGIGYTLLRLAYLQRLPSILTLASPLDVAG